MRYAAAILLLVVLARAGLAQTVNDATLAVDQVISIPNVQTTGMAFLPNGDAFVLEKDSGKVRLLKGRTLQNAAVLDLDVANDSEEGLLSIALHPNFSSNGFAYLYYTQGNVDGGVPSANRIDRFHWNGSQLTFDRHIKELPAAPGPNHNGGKIIFGPDKKLYSVTGDLNRTEKTENFERSSRLSRSAVILRLNDDGKAPRDNPFFNKKNKGAKAPLNEIYAYGVRNSFGMDFDPVSKVLWDSENGPTEMDEINRVRAGFNSGWSDVMGPKSRSGGSFFRLAKLGKKAKYTDPQLSWKAVVAPTDVEFFESDAMNDTRINDMFVGDISGNLYDIDLIPNRKSLKLGGGLSDRVVDNTAEKNSLRLGSGFGIVTDLISRPDGLYVLNLDGDLYRIATIGTPGPAALASGGLMTRAVPEPASIGLLGCALVLLNSRRSALRKRIEK